MTCHPTRIELRPPQGNEKEDGRAEECNKGKNRPKLRPYGQEDRFSLHHSSLRVPSALEVSPTTARTV